MMKGMPSRKIAFISSFLPRKCGIATFTSDLIQNIRLAGGMDFCPLVIAMQSGQEHKYARPVEFVVRREVAADYADAADYINSKKLDAVSLQHEFGLFGGEAGSYITVLLKRLRAPVVTTLHTVLERPSMEHFDALDGICEASETVVVMNKRGVRMLTNLYGVPERKIKLIPHGIPDIPFDRTGFCKPVTNSSGRKVILTFGLISRNKGIEVMLRAMSAIVKAHPETLYIVLGTTHPDLVKNEGYSYRNELLQMVEELKLENHVVFHEKFVSDLELREFLCAADIYATPYLYREQLTSGTLAFAVGAGKAVVSTPYWAAEELLAAGRGKLVPFGDSEQMASVIMQLLDDESARYRMQLRAYEYGRAMTWPKVGRAYRKLLAGEQDPVSITAEPITMATTPDSRVAGLPPAADGAVALNHPISLRS
jgi:glycosyltransferase involved in cell wall biosynthesis